MKKVNIFILAILLLTAGCGGCKQSGNDDLITVDVTKSYPKKELILQDIFDVEYIPLETNNEFLTQGRVLAISKYLIFVRNRMDDGDVFIFDRTTGKGLKKINRIGKGPEEYRYYLEITIDDELSEIYVNDIISQKIIIYDFEGKFKRSFGRKDGITFLYNFDQENLICNDGYFDGKNGGMHPFLLISKRDGRITKEIQIPYKKKINTGVAGAPYFLFINYAPISYYFGNWILVCPSSDTIYKYQPDYTMTPLVARTPSIQSTKPQIFLFMRIITDRYYFMEKIIKVYDPATKNTPSKDLLYDRKKKSIFEYKVYNNDYAEKNLVSLKASTLLAISIPRPENDEIATWQVLEADQLVEDFEKGKLKGKLKEIAAGLKEEDNPVIMLVKHKK